MTATRTSNIVLMHFNDVYELASDEALRFVYAFMREYEHYKSQGYAVVVFFSGDVFSPSLLSKVMKGEHMIPLLNRLPIHVSMVGNHDMDFGIPKLKDLISQTQFPWLLTNFLDRASQVPAAGHSYCIVSVGSDGAISQFVDEAGCNHLLDAGDELVNGEVARIGVIGLMEFEWLELLPTDCNEELLEYVDFIEAARTIVQPILVEKYGCDYIIALTHMRSKRDRILLKVCDELGIHMILGGHDHTVALDVNEENSTVFCKSGADFKYFSVIHLNHHDQHPLPVADKHSFKKEAVYVLKHGHAIKVATVSVDLSTEPDDKDQETQHLAEKLVQHLNDQLSFPVVIAMNDMDATYETVRSCESNFCNVVCDIVRHFLEADICIDGGGACRINDIIPKGVVTALQIASAFPYDDEIVSIAVPPTSLWAALENSVSQLPAKDGRFSHLSGIRIVHDNGKLLSASLQNPITGEYDTDLKTLDESRVLSVACRSWLALGKDGFDVFGPCPLVRGQRKADGVCIRDILYRFFRFVSQQSADDDVHLSDIRDGKAVRKWKRLFELFRKAEVTVDEPYRIPKAVLEQNKGNLAPFSLFASIENRIVNVHDG